jgi:TPR repeat protein
LLVMLRALSAGKDMDVGEVALVAARHALEDAHLNRLLCALFAALALCDPATTELDELVSRAARLAESSGKTIRPLTAEQAEASLDQRANQGDSWAAFALGRALCGIDCGAMPPGDLVTGSNVRRGAALLLRAADSGWEEAWLHLYRLHADHRLSVANPQMARFCLEKAAVLGQKQAQCKLGALMLRSANSLVDSEQAISWLHQAATQGDDHALDLLTSLHLPLEGSDQDARAAIDQVRRDYPWLAMRMQLSRDFGLTKLEALCVDPAMGLRPWGLVVGKNPFIVQSRLSAPRAVPAITESALDNLRRTALLFSESGRDGYLLEGDARRRSLVQRRAFERHGLDEAMFFAKASANTLNTLRQGSKWAFRAKAQIQLALAA